MRERATTTQTRSAQTSAVVLGGGYVLAAAAGLFLTGRVPLVTGVFGAVLVLLYALAYRTEFVSTTGSAVPTQPILVGMLLLLPLPLVPFAVLVGLQIGGLGAAEAQSRVGTLLVRSLNGWHCLGPVAVLLLAGEPAPSLANAHVYALALAVQFVVDAAIGLLRAAVHGVDPRRLAAPLAWTFGVDTVLAAMGLCIVLATDPSRTIIEGSGHSPSTLILLAAPIGLVALLARDRSTHLQTAVTLSTAYTSVQEEARVDPLTGLANRRAWNETLAAATDLCRSDPGLLVSVVVADLDGLKKVNDSQGHEAGDVMIRAMADVLRTAVPQAQILARLGGDEFGAVLVGTRSEPGSEGAAQAVVTDLRVAMRAHPGVGGSALSASVGLAQCPPATSVEDAARHADELASQDKRERRVGRV